MNHDEQINAITRYFPELVITTLESFPPKFTWSFRNVSSTHDHDETFNSPTAAVAHFAYTRVRQSDMYLKAEEDESLPPGFTDPYTDREVLGEDHRC